jgi:hypothetical protein
VGPVLVALRVLVGEAEVNMYILLIFASLLVADGIIWSD